MKSYEVTFFVLYGEIILRDPWCDAGDDGEAYRDAQGQVAGASTYQISVRPLVTSQPTKLELRTWDAEPESPEGSWDGCRQLELHMPTGELFVEVHTVPAMVATELPGGPGVYGVRVYRGSYDGAEKFLIDMWWRAVLPPADDDEDFYGDSWS